MENINLKMSVGATGPGTTLTIALDQQVIWSGDPGENPQTVSYDFPDTESEHLLVLTLSGKSEEHTIVDDQGAITQDLLVSVRGFFLDGIDIDQLVWEKSQYLHDFNGSQEKIIDRFFGDIGCNGQVEFRFSSPVYIWLLENT